MDTTLADALVGRVLDGRYRVEERIARGGMATVYRAVDTRLDRPVAIKVMHPALAEDPDFVARFTREAKAAARLSHPNVVAVFDQGADVGVVFLVMEYVDGATLRDLIRSRGRLSPRQTLDVLVPILSALDAAHRAGIVHRDIKPENVLISSEGRIKVADFGLARAIAASQTTATTGLLIGTAAYLAPEQIEKGVADPRTDLYAVGIVAYELLTGRPPYEGPTPMVVVFKHVHEQVPAPSSVRPEVPRSVDALVLDATQRDPEDRPPSAAELLAQLQAAARTLPPEPLDLTQPTQVLGLHTTTVIGGGARPDHTLVAPPDWPPAGPTAPTTAPGGPARAPRRHWWRGWRLAVLLLVIATVAAAASGAYLGIKNHDRANGAASSGTPSAAAPTSTAATTVSMPDFTGKSQLEADQLAAQNQLAAPTYAASQFDPTAPAGTVISQSVAKQTPVALQSSVTLTLSKGPQPIDVPTTIVGMTTDDAAAALEAVGLDLGKHPSQYDPTHLKGRIISVTTSSPQPKGTPIDVLVSKGPQPVAVPDESGKSLADAQVDLKAKGFTNVGKITDYSDKTPLGDVISQTPKLPASVQPGAPITLVVSKGPQLFAVPDLYGLTIDQAKAKLAHVGMVADVNVLLSPSGHVLRQSPRHGDLRPAGTRVRIDIF